MTRGKTLVGRMAILQMTVLAVAVGLVVLLSFAGMSRLLARQRDETLRGVATRTLAAVLQYGGRSAQTPVILHEVEEHRPEGIRVEVVAKDGRVLAGVGEGPNLAPAGSGDCADRDDFRQCTRQDGELAVVAGRSVVGDAAMLARLFWIVLGACATVLALGAVVSRFVARRGLAPLASFSTRLASIEPGDGTRLGTTGGIREIDEVAARFDDLLRRIDEAMTRERRFSAQASHELRTPLTVLRGELELSLREPTLSRQATSRALASAETMARLVEVLLHFSRAQSMFQAKDLQLLNLCDLIRDELARTAHRAPEDAARLTATMPEEALVLGEERLLVHAVVNLIDNAWKHTPAGVTIEVSVLLLPATVELRVADHGPGVSPEHRERIFEPFFRDPASRARTDGYGLGLPFARSVARAHGGDVWLETDRLVGASFVMRLPRAP